MLADCGLACELGANGVGMSYRGTPGYMAPEMTVLGSFGYSADSWSLGVMLAEMVAGVRISEIIQKAGNKLTGKEEMTPLCAVLEADIEGLPGLPQKVLPVLPVLRALLHPDRVTRPMAAAVVPLVDEVLLNLLSGQQ